MSMTSKEQWIGSPVDFQKSSKSSKFGGILEKS